MYVSEFDREEKIGLQWATFIVVWAKRDKHSDQIKYPLYFVF